MLRRFVELRPVVEMYIASDDCFKQYALSDAEWELPNEIMSLFKPLSVATIGLSQSKYFSISFTLPIYIGLIKIFMLFIHRTQDHCKFKFFSMS
jgi:hypothetical protein